MQSIDHRVPSDGDMFLRHSLAHEFLASKRGRGEVKRGQLRREAAVGFLWERIEQVMTPQTSLNVADGNVQIKGGECGGKNGGRIALYQEEIWLQVAQSVLHHVEYPCIEVCQGLLRTHEVEVHIRANLKERQNLVEHLAMLRRGDDDGFYGVRLCLQRVDNGSHLNGLGTCPHDHSNA